MNRRIAHHNDGTWRMDWYTFQSLPFKNIVNHMELKRPRKGKPHAVRGGRKVREFV